MDLLSSLDLSKKEIGRIFELADRHMPAHSRSGPLLALLFEKSSTRTRVSFESAVHGLGGSAVYIDSRTSQMSRGESIGDTARVLSSYVDIISARMNRHQDIVALADAADVPVINALTDLEHPCQALSDVYTIKKHFGRISGLRIAFVGDIAANTANSLMVTAAKMGAEISLVGPDACEPSKAYVDGASECSLVEISNSMQDGLEGCHVVYTDTYVSMGQEADAARRRKLFAKYQINAKAMRYARDGAVAMHCLPAHRGEEITSEVLDGKASLAWKQAANKMPVERAILFYLLNNAD